MRKTTLPMLVDPAIHKTGAFSMAMKRAFIDPIRDAMNRTTYGLPQRDPAEIAWEDAVKWIERNEAVKAEWPWPARS